MKRTITADMARAAYDYDPATGHLTHRKSRGRAIAGERAGSPKPSGYRSVRLDNRFFQSARVVWLHYYGEWPKNQIDHINHKRDDDRIANLRDVTGHINLHNQSGRRSNNTSGVVGVHLNRTSGKYHATIWKNRKCIFLGCFAEFSEAVEARRRGKEVHHKDGKAA